MPSAKQIAEFFKSGKEVEGKFEGLNTPPPAAPQSLLADAVAKSTDEIGWNGPRKDPNYDENGQWTGPVPDPDRPVNEMYHAARQDFLAIPATMTEEQLRTRQKIIDLESLNAAVNAPPPGDWDTWREQFTARVTALGFGVQYQTDDGTIRILQMGNVFAIHKDYRTAVGWLVKTEIERRNAEQAKRNKEADAVRAQAEAASTDNPATHPAVLEAIMDRLAAIEKKLG